MLKSESIAVDMITRGQLSDTSANIFIKNFANGIFNTVWTS